MLKTANLRYHVANPTDLHYLTPSTIICIASATQFIQLSSPIFGILYISGYSYASDPSIIPVYTMARVSQGTDALRLPN